MENWETDWSRDVLERIVALLFALAGLAELAADAPFDCRRQVLGILSHGEAEARAFVIGVATDEPAPIDAPESADDATRLAVRLRALALMLCVLLAQARQFAPPGTVGSQAGRPSHEVFGLPVRRPVAPAPPAPDTS